MFQVWEAAGGNAEYHLLPAFRQEGHLLVDYPQAVAFWAPIVQRFLAEHPDRGQDMCLSHPSVQRRPTH
jgi:hypothetical protein